MEVCIKDKDQVIASFFKDSNQNLTDNLSYEQLIEIGITLKAAAMQAKISAVQVKLVSILKSAKVEYMLIDGTDKYKCEITLADNKVITGDGAVIEHNDINKQKIAAFNEAQSKIQLLILTDRI